MAAEVPGSRWPSVPAGALALAALCLLAFWGALDNAYLLDDEGRLLFNPEVRRVSPWWRHFLDPTTLSPEPSLQEYRPLLPLTLSVSHALSGMSRRGMRAGNLLLHLLATLAVYALLRELVRRAPRGPPVSGAWVAAALFAVHPVSGIPVNYVTARDLILMQLFLFLALRAHLWWRGRGGAARALLPAGLLALSLGSKLVAAVAPGLVLLHELLLEGGSLRDGRTWRRVAPSLLVVVGFGVWVRGVLGFSPASTTVGEGAWTYLPTQLRVHVLHYLPHFLWPFPIRFGPDVEPVGFLDPGALLGLATVVGLAAWGWRARAREPLLVLCAGAYALLLVPTSSVVPLMHLVIPYRPYPASPFLYLALATLGARLLRPRLRRPAAIGAVLFALLATWRMNAHFESPRALWTHSLRYGANAFAQLSLAASVEDPELRLGILERTVERWPEHVRARRRWLAALLAAGHGERAAEGLEVLRGLPEPGELDHLEELVGVARGAPPEAGSREPLGHRALREAYRVGADALVLGNLEVARAALRRVVATDPAYRGAGFLLGVARLRAGDPEGARRAFAEARRLLDAGHTLTLGEVSPEALRAQLEEQDRIAREAYP